MQICQIQDELSKIDLKVTIISSIFAISKLSLVIAKLFRTINYSEST